MKKPIAKLLNPEEFESNTTLAIVKKNWIKKDIEFKLPCSMESLVTIILTGNEDSKNHKDKSTY